MQTITALVNDNYPGTPNPLIYTVQVTSLDHDSVLAAVMVERIKDTGCDADELDLDLLLAFSGDISTVADWRGE